MKLFLIIIILILFLYFTRQNFKSLSAISNRSTDPIWFDFYGDKHMLSRGYSEKDFYLADVLVRDLWKSN